MISLFDFEENGVGDGAAGADFVAAVVEGCGAAAVEIESVGHAHGVEDFGSFGGGGVADDTDVRHVVFGSDETAGAFAGEFAVGGTAKVDLAVEDEKWVIGDDGIWSGVSAPFEGLGDEAGGVALENDGGDCAVDVVG